jgi:TPR repeat protein
MLKFIEYLINLNGAMAQRIRAIQIYDQALAYDDAKEYRKSAPLYKEAAELGNANAMALYGSALLLGRGVPENGAEAVKWLQLAMDRQQSGAAATLGMAYATGKAGVKPNHKLARELLTKAAADGDTQSANMLELMDKKKGIFKNMRA